MRLEIDFLNSQRMLEWDGIKVPFVKKGFWNEQTIEAFIQKEHSFVDQHYEAPLKRLTRRTFCSSWTKFNLWRMHSTSNQICGKWPWCKSISTVLSKIDWQNVNETWGFVPGSTWQLNRRSSDNPPVWWSTAIYGKPYNIPVKNQEQFKQELGWQCDIGTMRKLSGVETESAKWAFGAFPVAKQDNSICLVHDFCSINSQLKRSEHPLPMIEGTLVNIGTFCWVTKMDLNMGYMSMPLCEQMQKVLWITTQLGFYENLVLPQGISVATDIFQQWMQSLFVDMPAPPITCIDDLLYHSNGTFAEHLDNMPGGC